MRNADTSPEEAGQSTGRFSPPIRPVQPGPCCASGITFEDASHVIRRGLGVGSEPLTLEELENEPNIIAQGRHLAAWADSDELWVEDAVAKRILASTAFGSEHYVLPFIDAANEQLLRMWKVTKGGFGKMLRVLEAGPYPKNWFKLGEANPLEYFSRMALMNQLAPGLETRLEGFVLLGDRVGVVTSQLFVRSSSASTGTTSIEEYCKSKGLTHC